MLRFPQLGASHLRREVHPYLQIEAASTAHTSCKTSPHHEKENPSAFFTQNGENVDPTHVTSLTQIAERKTSPDLYESHISRNILMTNPQPSPNRCYDHQKLVPRPLKRAANSLKRRPSPYFSVITEHSRQKTLHRLRYHVSIILK